MQRYFAIDEKLTLDSSDIYHIYKVMRMQPDDKIEVIYNGAIHLCQLKEVSVNSVKLDVLEKKTVNNELSWGITIAVSMVSEQKWDYILQKATELGVSEIIPLQLSRTLIKLDKSKSDKKIERWIKICKEASEQSHRTVVPNILNVMKVTDLIKSDYDLKLVCSTGVGSTNVKQILSNYEKCGRILVVIGPEGGISPDEEELLVQNGFSRVSLGNFILRVETAPLFVLSAINYELMR
jgi:16S rRNA (uracil1498-N3)-methyltransferase